MDNDLLLRLRATTKERPLLLSIPTAEILGSEGGKTTIVASPPPQPKKKTRAASGQLLLLQLPAGCPSLRRRHNKNVRQYFVGTAATSAGSSGGDEDAVRNNNNNNGRTTTAALIIGDQSYNVHRVETSNTLLLIPPPCPPSPIIVEEERHNNNNNNNSPSTCTTTNNSTVLVHRLGGGNVSASFLELRRKYLHASDVIRALPVWDPFHNDNNNDDDDRHQRPQQQHFVPLRELAHVLQASERELRDFLDTVLGDRVVALFDNDNDDSYIRRYALMTEQVQQICATAIVATLAEDDTYSSSSSAHGGRHRRPDNDDDGMMVDGEDEKSKQQPLVLVKLDALVDKAMERIIPSERFNHMAPAIRHVVRHSFALTTTTTTMAADDDQVVLDWEKVAGWVARQLLLSRTTTDEPWTDDEFMTTWQNEMPGIDFTVHRDMLRGIAVSVVLSSSTTTTTKQQPQQNQPNPPPLPGCQQQRWCYVPTDGIYTAPELFAVLFQVQEKWARTELQPYLERLCRADPSIVSPDQLLVRFTSPVAVAATTASHHPPPGGGGGRLDVTLYQRKGSGETGKLSNRNIF